MALRARDGSRMLPLEYANELSIAEQGVVGACGRFQHHLADPDTTYCAVYTRDDLQKQASAYTSGVAPGDGAAAMDRSVADFATAAQFDGKGNNKPVVFDFGGALPTRAGGAPLQLDPRVPISLLLAQREADTAAISGDVKKKGKKGKKGKKKEEEV